MYFAYFQDLSLRCNTKSIHKIEHFFNSNNNRNNFSDSAHMFNALFN